MATDASGRVTRLDERGVARTLTWDAADRLREVHTTGPGRSDTAVAYAYDPAGRRVGATDVRPYSSGWTASWRWGPDGQVFAEDPGAGPVVYQRAGGSGVRN